MSDNEKFVLVPRETVQRARNVVCTLAESRASLGARCKDTESLLMRMDALLAATPPQPPVGQGARAVADGHVDGARCATWSECPKCNPTSATEPVAWMLHDKDGQREAIMTYEYSPDSQPASTAAQAGGAEFDAWWNHGGRELVAMARELRFGAELIWRAAIVSRSPSHTDLMVTPESLDKYLQNNPPPAQPASVSVPDGFVLVPREPTETMCATAWDVIRDGNYNPDRYGSMYRAMIAAAPQPDEKWRKS